MQNILMLIAAMAIGLTTSAAAADAKISEVPLATGGLQAADRVPVAEYITGSNYASRALTGQQIADGVKTMLGLGDAALLDDSDLIGAVTIERTIISSSGMYTVPAGTVQALVQCWGGGGAGGGAGDPILGTMAAAGSGGAAGSSASRILTAAAIGESQIVTIGDGGAGAAGAWGEDGDDTSFGALVIAKGGEGGGPLGPAAIGSIYGGFGVPGGTGQVTAPGQNGGAGFIVNSQFMMGGDGGSSAVGSGGAGQQRNNGNGMNGAGYAAGGGGAANFETASSAAAGGNGAPGLCIVDALIKAAP